MAAPARLDDPDRPGAAPDPLFRSGELLAVRVAGPIEAVAWDRADEPDEQPAVLSWVEGGREISLDIEIRARGKSRRRREICDFPPIRLDLPKSRTAGTLFDGQDKLKLVTHCKGLGNTAIGGRDWVALEYLAYRLLNRVTEYGFKVRPLQVTWVTERAREHVHPGFVIEDKDRLAARLGLDVSELEGIAPAALAPRTTAVMELFEYLVGNTDFSFVAGPGGERCCHNAVLLTDGERFVPVPYDFDLTGLVDKPGALPAEGLGIQRVTQRRFVGFCREERYLREALPRYVAAREAMRAELDAIPAAWGMSRRARRHAEQFLEEFYETLARERLVERDLLGRCKPPR